MSFWNYFPEGDINKVYSSSSGPKDKPRYDSTTVHSREPVSLLHLLTEHNWGLPTGAWVFFAIKPHQKVLPNRDENIFIAAKMEPPPLEFPDYTYTPSSSRGQIQWKWSYIQWMVTSDWILKWSSVFSLVLHEGCT